MPKNPKYKDLYKIIRQFRRDFSTDLPFKVIRKRLKGFFGYTTKTKQYYYIYIDDRLNEDFATHIWIHEILHVLSWDSQQIDHGLEFGKAYSRVYRWFEKKYL